MVRLRIRSIEGAMIGSGLLLELHISSVSILDKIALEACRFLLVGKKCPCFSYIHSIHIKQRVR